MQQLLKLFEHEVAQLEGLNTLGQAEIAQLRKMVDAYEECRCKLGTVKADRETLTDLIRRSHVLLKKARETA